MYVLGLMVIDDKERTEEVIRSGTLNVTGRLVDASNATLYALAVVENDEVSCIYKPIAGERPLWDFPDGTLAHREYAAYLVSEEMGLRVVPFTILREGPFGQGMVQKWIDIDDSIDLMNFFSQDIPQLRAMALFDAVINNTDRKIGHLLPTHSGEVLGCDHGVSFHSEDKLRSVLWQWAGTPLHDFEREQLQRFTLALAGHFGQKMLNHISEDELSALKTRTLRITHEGVFPSPSTQWPAVPWPPF